MLKIKILREENGLTQQELAERLSRKKASVCDWEKGRCEPSIFDLIKLAEIFNCSVDYLLGREDDFGFIQSSADEYTSAEKRIISIYRGLSEREKTLFDNLVNSFDDNLQKEKSSRA